MTESGLEGSWQAEEPSAAARGISLGVALGGLLWAAAILTLRALV
jgi:hypothetical protein